MNRQARIAIITIFIIVIFISINLIMNRTNTDIEQDISSIDMASSNDNGYVKIQNRMSLDFSDYDAHCIYALIDAKGGSVEDRAYNMVVLLNNMYDTKLPIERYVTDELDYVSFEYKDKDLDDKAFQMVMYEQWDETNGSRSYK